MARRQGAPAIAGNGDGPVEVQSTAQVAAARRIDLEGTERDGYRRKAKRETWQSESWSFFDIVGEVKQPTYFLANTCGLVRLFIGHQPDPQQDPVEAPAGMPGVFEANDVLDRLRQGSRSGVAGLMREHILNHKIAGECWLAGIPEKPAVPPTDDNPEGEPYRPETWDTRSVSEVFTKGSGRNLRYWYREDPEDSKGKPFPEGTFLLRVWLEHPEFSELADCALRALLTECEELLILTRAVKAVGRSRLAGNGILFLSNELEIVTPPRQSTEPVGPTNPKGPSFVERLMEAMTIPIQNEGDPSAVVPLVVRGPTTAIKDGVHWEKFERTLDGTMIEQRRELIQRLAQGSDVPIEVIVGLRNVNHWTAYQVDQSTWTRYGHPAVRSVVDAWTTGLLRPMLEEAGLSPEVASQLMIWFDPAGAVTEPDRSSVVIQAFDRFGISFDALRTYLQLSESDAPDDAEIARRIEIAVALKGGAATADGGGAGPAGVGDGSGQGAPNEGVPPTSPIEQAVRDAVESFPEGPEKRRIEAAIDEANEYLRLNGGRLPVIAEAPATRRALPAPSAQRSRTAAARRRNQPLGRRLLSIDRRLRDQLQSLADAALMRALDQAGARLRNRAKKAPALAASVRDVAAHEVPARLGPNVAQSLGLNDDDLLAGNFEALEPKFLQKVAAAQQQTLDMLAAEYGLDEDEIRALTTQQQRDRSDAWAWLAGAMLVLGHDRLYNPQPEAPARGEFDASTSVPPELLREAMARAGGAAEAAVGAERRPSGGVALGQLVQDVWAQHGQVVDGWEWVYGDPSSRTTPFEPHADLDGVQFASWDDDVLLNSGDWPPVPYLRPGDHLWCQCDFVAVGPGALGGSDEETSDEEVPAE